MALFKIMIFDTVARLLFLDEAKLESYIYLAPTTVVISTVAVFIFEFLFSIKRQFYI